MDKRLVINCRGLPVNLPVNGEARARLHWDDLWSASVSRDQAAEGPGFGTKRSGDLRGRRRTGQLADRVGLPNHAGE